MRQYFFRYFRPIVSVGLIGGAFVIGLGGWLLEDKSFLEALYATMGLFVIDGNVEPEHNGLLLIARYLAPLATVVGVLVAFVDVVTAWLSRRLASRRKGHLVVLGAGPEALDLALASPKEKPVWVGETTLDQLVRLRAAGVIVVQAASDGTLKRIIKRARTVVIDASDDRTASDLTNKVQKFNKDLRAKPLRGGHDPAVITLLDSRDVARYWRQRIADEARAARSGAPTRGNWSVENDRVICRSEHVAASVLTDTAPYDKTRATGWPIVLGDGRLAAELIGRIFEDWQQPGESITVHWGGPPDARRFLAERGLEVAAREPESPDGTSTTPRRHRVWPPTPIVERLETPQRPSDAQGFGRLIGHEVPTGVFAVLRVVEDALREWEESWASFPQRGRYARGTPRVYVAYEDDAFVVPLAHALRQRFGDDVIVAAVPADDSLAGSLLGGNPNQFTGKQVLCDPDTLREPLATELQRELKAELGRWPDPAKKEMAVDSHDMWRLSSKADELVGVAGLSIVPAPAGASEVTVLTPSELLSISEAMRAELGIDEDSYTWERRTQLIELAGRMPALLKRVRRVLVRKNGDRDPILVEQLSPLAQLAHHGYKEVSKKTGNATRSEVAALKWAELPDLERSSNVAQVLDISVKLALLGLRLEKAVSRESGDVPVEHEFTGDEVEILAMQEHRRWAHFQMRNGRKDHNWNLPWEILREEAREYDRKAVRLIPRLLHEVGLVMVADDAGRANLPELPKVTAPEGRFSRNVKGTEVRATRLTAPRTWVSTAGDRLTAEAGDWWVVTGDRKHPDVRSVKPDAFARTYALIEGNRYKRVGEVSARQVLEAEVVETSEGPATAQINDWIITDAAGARWPVPADRFKDLYTPVLRE
ncbi:MAG TPA: hypothetical protein PKE40_01300 [Arachnia sp.]|nr:hypothetical protein [Arachnia sp.]HMT84964.1 hypothetical protein [Arachnia sp.]